MAHLVSSKSNENTDKYPRRQKRLIKGAAALFTLAAFGTAYCLFNQASIVAPVLILSFASMVGVTICLGEFLAEQVTLNRSTDTHLSLEVS